MEKQWKQWLILFWGDSKSTADGDCSHEIKRCLLLGRKVMTNLDSILDFPGGSDGKASVYNAGDLGSIPGLGRFPGEDNGNPLQYSCLENPMDGGAWCRLLSMGSQRVGHD